jgi:hypothetical protein
MVCGLLFFCFSRLMLWHAVCCGDAFGLLVERFENPLPIADALRRRQQLQQRCGYFQCGQQAVDNCFSQFGSRQSCSDIAAESWTGHLRRWRRFVSDLLFAIDDAACCVLWEGKR